MKHSVATTPSLGAPVDWTGALMEDGFDALSQLPTSPDHIRATRDLYAEFRTRVDQVVRGAERVELVICATAVDHTGREDDALLIVTNTMLIICIVRRHRLTARPTTLLLPRATLTATPTMLNDRRVIQLQADGRRVSIAFVAGSPELEKALLQGVYRSGWRQT